MVEHQHDNNQLCLVHFHLNSFCLLCRTYSGITVELLCKNVNVVLSHTIIYYTVMIIGTEPKAYLYITQL